MSVAFLALVMSDFQIPFTVGRPLQDNLRAITDPIRSLVKAGFERLRRGGLDVGAMVEASAEYFETAAVLDPAEFTATHSNIPLTKEEIRPVLSAVSLLSVVLISNEGIADKEVADNLVAAELAANADESMILNVAREVRARQSVFAQAQDRVRLGQAILPSFQSLFFTVDLRPRIRSGAVSFVVPVAVGILSTDTGKQMFFQATRPDLERVSREVRRVLRSMDVAQDWADKPRKE